MVCAMAVWQHREEWIVCMMLDRMKAASDCYRKGCTCSQALLCAYADEMGIEKETAYRMMEGFGCGMGEMQELCSALAAAICVIGFHASEGMPQKGCGGVKDGCSSLGTYGQVKYVMEIFRREYGGVTCRDILRGTSPEETDCGMKVKDMVIMIDRVLYEMELEKE